MKLIWNCFIALFAIVGTGLAYASIIIPIHMTDADGNGKDIGTVKAEDASYGLILTPELKDLPAGVHGFHIHETAMCVHNGMAAGGHYDPAKTGKHLGPYGEGHLGDLPPLIVDANGNSSLPVLAPRLKLKDIEGRALMIHAGGDNYSDQPEKLGGGGARIACGVIPTH